MASRAKFLKRVRVGNVRNPLIPVKSKKSIPNANGNYDGHSTPKATLRALRNHGVPRTQVLNPYGRTGFVKPDIEPAYQPSYRGAAMKRRRVKIQEKKAIALEARECQQIARENASLAMATLAEIAGDKRAPQGSRIAASSVILDRAYGKSSQTSITANVSNGKTKDIDANELDKRIGQALKRVEDLTNRTVKEGKSEERPADVRIYN